MRPFLKGRQSKKLGFFTYDSGEVSPHFAISTFRVVAMECPKSWETPRLGPPPFVDPPPN
jgi:hypothetical protein